MPVGKDKPYDFGLSFRYFFLDLNSRELQWMPHFASQHHLYLIACLSLFLFAFACAVVREERGPYNDPQHPYFYEEDDVWMAPGFINQFYEVSQYKIST